MARRVNTRFVVILTVVLVAVVSGGVLLALKVSTTAAEHVAMGDQALVDAKTQLDAGDVEAANLFYKRAWTNYGNAFSDEPNNPEHLQRVVDVHYQYVCLTLTDATNQINDIAGVLRQAYDHNNARETDRTRFLETMMRFHREQVLLNGSMPWISMINSATKSTVIANPDDHLARRYLAISGVYFYRNDMREPERLAIKENLELALKNDPKDAAVLLYLAQFQFREAQRIRAAEGGQINDAVRNLYTQAAQTNQQGLEAASNDPQSVIDYLGLALSLPADIVDREPLVETARQLAEHLTKDADARKPLASNDLSRFASFLRLLSAVQSDPALAQQGLDVLEASTKDHPDSPSYRVAYAQALSGIGQLESALKQIEAGLVIKKRLNAEQYLLNLEAHTLLLAMATEANTNLAERAEDGDAQTRYLAAAEKSLSSYRDAEGGESNQRRALAEFLAGKIDTVRNRPQLALIHLEKANTLFNSGHLETLKLLGRNHQLAQNLGKAIEYYERALSLRPEAEPRLLLAQLYLQLGASNVPQAIDHLNRFLEERPEDARGHLLRAEAIAIAGQPEQAAAIIQQMDLEANPRLKTNLARYMSLAGQKEQAIATLRERLAEDVNDLAAVQLLLQLLDSPETRLAEINTLQTAGLDTERADTLRKLIELNASGSLEDQEHMIEETGGDDLTIALRLFQLFQSRGDTDQAKVQLQKAAALKPNNPDVLEWQFRFALDDGNEQEAQRLISKMVALPAVDRPKIASADGAFLRAMLQATLLLKNESPSPQARQRLINDYRQALEKDQNFIDGWIQLSQLLANAGQWTESRAAIQKAYELQPNNYRAIGIYAQTMANTGDAARAVELLSNALRSQPNNVLLRNQYLALATQANYLDIVLQERLRIREAQPTDFNNRRALVELHLQMEQKDQALAEMNSVIQDEGISLSNAWGLTRVHMQRDEQPQARKTLEDFVNSRGDQATTDDYLLLAQLLLQLKDPAQAQAMFQKAAQLDTTEPMQASRIFASALLQHQQFADAARLYRELIEKFPEDGGLRTDLARSLLLAGAFEEARVALKAAPATPENALILVDIELNQNKMDDAIKAVTQAIRDFPKHTGVALAYGRLMLDNNQPDKAAPVIQALAKREPNRPDVALIQARLELIQGNRDQARQRLVAVLQTAPNYSAAREALFSVQLSDSLEMSRTNPAGARQLAVEALATITPLVDSNPDNPAANRLAGQAASIAQQHDRAITYYDRAFTTSRAAGDLLNLAQAMINAGTAADAVTILTSPDNAALLRESIELRVIWAQALAQAGQQDQATNLFTNLIKENNNPATQSTIARIACQSLPLDRGIALVQDATGTNRSPQIDFVLSGLENENGRWADAIARLKKYEANPPANNSDKLGVLGNLALAYQNSGQADQAKQLYEALLAENPNEMNLLNNFAYLLCEDLPGYEQQAVDLSRRAVKVLNDSGQATDHSRALVLDTLGWSEYRAGQIPQAVKTLEKSVQTKALYANLLHLGQVYAASGDQARASRTLRLARDEAQRSNNAEDLAEVNRILQEIEQ